MSGINPVTRREALLGGAALALARLFGVPTAPARAAVGPLGDVAEVTMAIPAHAFRRTRSRGRLLTTPALRLPRRLDVLGLSWQDPQEARLELRTRRRGRWSRWVSLPAAADHAPDDRVPPRATEAAAVGRAKVFQLRAVTVPRGLRAHGIALTHPVGRPRLRTASSALPAVIPREDWLAQAPREAPSYGEVQLAFVHHTVSTNDYGPDESAAIVRSIQHYHRNVLGWDDIGYQLLVDRHGQVFEGRAGGIDQAVIGAQAQGYNSVSTGVATIGTHTSQPVARAAFEALAAVLAWKLSLHGVPSEGEVTVTSAGGPANRYPAGRAVLLERISGHRDGDATACPGEALYAQLPALRARAAELSTPTGLSLALSPRRVEQLGAASASGLLRLADGAPGVGVQITLQARTARGWETIATTLTDAAGTWSAAVTLPHTRTLRALAHVDPAAPPLRSPQVRLEVRSTIAASIRPRRLRLGARTVVSGTVSPRLPMRRLIVTVERRAAAGRYLRVARFPATARAGRFRVPLEPSRPGLYRVRVSVRADRLNAPSRSGYLFARTSR